MDTVFNGNWVRRIIESALLYTEYVFLQVHHLNFYLINIFFSLLQRFLKGRVAVSSE